MEGIPKLWGICAESAWNDWHPDNPAREDTHRIVVRGNRRPRGGRRLRDLPPAQCPTCRSRYHILRVYFGLDGPCDDRWHTDLP